jgi:hypothetical protein
MTRHPRRGEGMIPIPPVICSRFLDSFMRSPASIYSMPNLGVKFELEIVAPGTSMIHVYTSRRPSESEGDEIHQLVCAIMRQNRLTGEFPR